MKTKIDYNFFCKIGRTNNVLNEEIKFNEIIYQLKFGGPQIKIEKIYFFDNKKTNSASDLIWKEGNFNIEISTFISLFANERQEWWLFKLSAEKYGIEKTELYLSKQNEQNFLEGIIFYTNNPLHWKDNFWSKF